MPCSIKNLYHLEVDFPVWFYMLPYDYANNALKVLGQLHVCKPSIGETAKFNFKLQWCVQVYGHTKSSNAFLYDSQSPPPPSFLHTTQLIYSPELRNNKFGTKRTLGRNNWFVVVNESITSKIPLRIWPRHISDCQRAWWAEWGQNGKKFPLHRSEFYTPFSLLHSYENREVISPHPVHQCNVLSETWTSNHVAFSEGNPGYYTLFKLQPQLTTTCSDWLKLSMFG